MTLKYAQTLDGRIATASGNSQWISGAESQTLAHRLRAEHDAVLVGVGTVLADDPSLTVRLWDGPNPLRVVADSSLRTPLFAAILRHAAETTLIATTPAASIEREADIRGLGARVLRLPQEGDRVDLAALLAALAGSGIRSILVEGGAGIATSLLRRRLVDQLLVILAPKIIGAGVEAVGDLGLRTMDQALTFRRHSFESLGPDMVFRGEIA